MKATAKRIARLAELLTEISRSLENGSIDTSMCWGDGTGTTYCRMLREIGIELVTETGARRRGHVLKRGAAPVAQKYFRAPIQRYAELFVLGLQTRLKPNPCFEHAQCCGALRCQRENGGAT